MRSKRILIAYLEGKTLTGEPVMLSLYRAGCTFHLVSLDREHVCHPSVGGLDDAIKEALLVFQVKVDRVSPC